MIVCVLVLVIRTGTLGLDSDRIGNLIRVSTERL
jgi:hypothetical protein